MNRRKTSVFLWLVAFGLTIGPGTAVEASQEKPKTSSTRMDPRQGPLRKWYGPLSPPAKEEPKAVARRFLKEHAHLFRMKGDPDELRVYWERKSPGGHHVRFQQVYEGVPVFGGYASVHLDRAGRVELVHDGYRPGLKSSLAAEQISPPQAIALARKELRVRGPLRGEIDVTQVVYPQEGRSRLAWQVAIPARRPLGDWLVLVDAVSGETLEVRNLLRFADGAGRVFDPNPVVTLRNRSLRDNNDNASAVPEGAYFSIPLPGLDGSGFLRGPFADTTLTPNSIREPGLLFHYNRSQPGFEEVMAYYHIDRYQRYIQETLGFTDVHNRPQRVNARAIIDFDGDEVPDPDQDNSFYSPFTGELFFGLGGVDDAEDADILLHEYGHALQEDAAPGFGGSFGYEAGVMGEGFSDYMAASFFAGRDFDATSTGCIGDWDTRDNFAPFPCLRQVANSKRYPDDMTRLNEHRDSEVWSGALWALRQALIEELGAEQGRVMADRLVFQSLFFLEPEDDFQAGAAAILQADRVLPESQGARQSLIRTVFAAWGIESPPALSPDPWEENDSFATASPIDLPFDQAGLTIDAPGDDDFYRFRLERDSVLTVQLDLVASAGNLDLYLLDSQEAIVDASRSTSGGRETVIASLAAGEYVVRVNGVNGATGSYRLLLAPWSLVINDGAEYATRRKVSLRLAAPGAVRVRLRNEEGRWSRWLAAFSSRSWRLSPGQGEKTLGAELQDENGRILGPLSGFVVVDTRRPQGGILLDEEGRKRRGLLINDGRRVITKARPEAPVHLTLLAEDQESGVVRMLLSNSRRFEGAEWEDYVPEKDWMLDPGGGKRSVFVRYQDRAGNVSARYRAKIRVVED